MTRYGSVTRLFRVAREREGGNPKKHEIDTLVMYTHGVRAHDLMSDVTKTQISQNLKAQHQ